MEAFQDVAFISTAIAIAFIYYSFILALRVFYLSSRLGHRRSITEFERALISLISPTEIISGSYSKKFGDDSYKFFRGLFIISLGAAFFTAYKLCSIGASYSLYDILLGYSGPIVTLSTIALKKKDLDRKIIAVAEKHDRRYIDISKRLSNILLRMVLVSVTMIVTLSGTLMMFIRTHFYSYRPMYVMLLVLLPFVPLIVTLFVAYVSPYLRFITVILFLFPIYVVRPIYRGHVDLGVFLGLFLGLVLLYAEILAKKS